MLLSMQIFHQHQDIPWLEITEIIPRKVKIAGPKEIIEKINLVNTIRI